MNDLLLDLRFGLRMMRMNAGFSAVVILLLALGIGANTTIFGVVNALLFVPLPYQDAESIVYVLETGGRSRDSGTTSSSTFLAWRSQSQTLDEMSALQSEAVNIAGRGEPERQGGVRVSDTALSLLGVAPAAGRAFRREEYEAGAEPVVMLGDRFWRRRFGSDPGIIGSSLRVNGRLCTVVGVMPPDLKMAYILGFEPTVWMPLAADPSGDRDSASVLVLARLKPGVSLGQARADMDVVSRHSGPAPDAAGVNPSIMVSPLRGEVDAVAYVLLVILVIAIVGLVCANVANLFLARGTTRTQELAVRAALGASRMRLLRQLLSENLLFLLLGGCLGVLSAVWACSLINRLSAGTNAGLLDIKVDLLVLAATAGLFCIAGAIVGLVPALQLSHRGLCRSLKDGDGHLAGSLSRNRMQRLLVVFEAAFSLLLLAGAGLTVKSWFHLWDVDPGFKADHVVTMRVSLAGDPYRHGDRRTAFFEELSGRLESIPGVRSVGWSSDLPTASPRRAFAVEGAAVPDAGHTPQARFTIVSPGYFAVMTLPLLKGRGFSAQDAVGSPPVAIINEIMARQFWNEENPIGTRINVSGATRTIVGIAGNVRSIPLSLKPVPEIFVPYTQMPAADVALVVQTTLADPFAIAPEVKRAVQAIDPDQPLSGITTMEQVCAANLGVIGLGTSVLSLVALGALMLASIGLYAVLSYSVTQRRKEISIRVALGARAIDVWGLVLGQGLVLTLWGLAPGMAAAVILGRILSRSMFGVSAVEPLLLACVSVIFILVASMACYLPARRAAAVSPVEAMRSL